MHLLDETAVAKIEQSLWEELLNNAEFAQEVRKLIAQFMSLSEQFQNSDSFIYMNGIFFHLSTASALEDEEQQLRCSANPKVVTSSEHCNEEF